MSDAKMKNEKDVSYTIHEFSIVMQLHVHATLCPTGAERDLPYIASLVPFTDCPVQFLDDLAMSVVGPQFHEAAPVSRGHEDSSAGDGHDDESGARAEDGETSASDDRQTPEGNGNDGSKADDSGGDTFSETGGGNTEDDEDPRDGSLVHYPLQWLARRHLGLHGQGSDIWSPHDDDRADEAEMQEGNDGEGGDEHSPQDDDRVEEGVMQEMNDPGETVPILPSDENEEGPSTHDVTEVDVDLALDEQVQQKEELTTVKKRMILSARVNEETQMQFAFRSKNTYRFLRQEHGHRVLILEGDA
ncbi:Hypothetical predicted protein [Olea europaea subsp. europaea]|uniref:Uncharacterized protein n=1 Tax=Olea europaea subsp. europaea TaxID=158383 RepID=A0A8S0SWH1_OLEEU|nr:Hypothetical predicted protein [Olea europaea subsp. europaea]